MWFGYAIDVEGKNNRCLFDDDRWFQSSCPYACDIERPLPQCMHQRPSFSENHQTCKLQKTAPIRLPPPSGPLLPTQTNLQPLVSSNIPPPPPCPIPPRSQRRPSFLTLLEHLILQLIRQPLMRLHALIAMHVALSAPLPIISQSPHTSNARPPSMQTRGGGRCLHQRGTCHNRSGSRASPSPGRRRRRRACRDRWA